MARNALAESVLAKMNGDPLRLAAIAELVGRGPKDGSVRNALGRLVAEGRLVRDGRLYRKVQTEASEVAPLHLAPAPPTIDALPAAPAQLGSAGRAVWDACSELGWIAPADAHSVLSLCRQEDEAAALVAVIGEQGTTLGRPIVTPRGEIAGEEFYAHPGLKELRRLDGQLATARARLGLDPTSRARQGLNILTPKRDRIDELQEQLRERRARNVGVA